MLEGKVENLSVLADITALVSALFAVLAWWQARLIHRHLKDEKRRQSQAIEIVLQNSSRRLKLPVSIPRGELTRAEVQGRLGMIPLNPESPQFKKGRYDLRALNTKEFFQRLDELREVDSKNSILVINCGDDEFEQFDLDRLENLSR